MFRFEVASFILEVLDFGLFRTFSAFWRRLEMALLFVALVSLILCNFRIKDFVNVLSILSTALVIKAIQIS